MLIHCLFINVIYPCLITKFFFLSFAFVCVKLHVSLPVSLRLCCLLTIVIFLSSSFALDKLKTLDECTMHFFITWPAKFFFFSFCGHFGQSLKVLVFTSSFRNWGLFDGRNTASKGYVSWMQESGWLVVGQSRQLVFREILSTVCL